MSSVRHDTSFDGAVRTLTVDAPPGNVLDTDTCHQLHEQLEVAAGDRQAKLLVIRGAGRHFSFGASVQEHLPEHARAMLEAMGSVLRDLVAFPYPTVAAVQGKCLGGGLELALACGPVLAEESAVFAAAEIRLGVFAPAATAFLQRGLPRGLAEEILLTGRDLTARQMQQRGLVTEVVAAGTLDEAVQRWALDYFLPRSGASLRIATRLLRAAWQTDFSRRLADLEEAYLTDLLELEDGSEGIRAFLEKRPPHWRNR